MTTISSHINAAWSFYRSKIPEVTAISYLVAILLFSITGTGIAPLA